MNIQTIADITGGELLKSIDNHLVESLCIDSRLATHLPSEIFIAFKGKNSNGHDYIDLLSKSGTQNFIIEDAIDLPSNANVIKVKSSLKALQSLARYKRAEFRGKVVGITGSNGKTIVKEWLTIILSTKHRVLASPKSYNSQLGVPLSIWPLNNQHEIGVFEAGISLPHEMEYLEQMIAPEIGIFTNIGSAHEENFNSQEDRVLEKLKLFKNSKALIYDEGDLKLSALIRENYKGELIGWSRGDGSPNIRVDENHHIHLKWKNVEHTFSTQFTDEASIQNIIHCIVCALYLGLDSTLIQQGIDGIKPVKMRLELKKGVRGNVIIDDTYNNDLAGLTKALNFMEQHGLHQKRVIILSDFIQSKIESNDFKKLNDLLISKEISSLIAVGQQLSSVQEFFQISSAFFTSTEALLESDTLEQIEDSLVLIKGSRKFALERVSLVLTEKVHLTKLEINLDAIRHNLNFYKSLIRPDTKVMAVIKAFAYGSGSIEVARLLEYNRVDYLAVAYADEGVTLRKEGIKTPIMVMNPTADDVYNLIKYKLEPEVYSLQQLQKFVASFETFEKKLSVHLIINTGMNRLGFNRSHIVELKAYLAANSGVEIKSIFTHLAASDAEEHEVFTQYQINEFKELSAELISVLANKPLLHILNSGGITRYAEAQFDMVRLGIGLHGVEVNRKYQNQLQKPAVLKTVISQIREIATGETIGYGRRGKALQPMRIAVIAIGYADGYLRTFGNGKAFVSIKGQQAKTIGNVCMDMTMVDVTGINVQEGDEVIVFGESPSVSDLAVWADTIPYEILTNVSNRVKRVFYSE